MSRPKSPINIGVVGLSSDGWASWGLTPPLYSQPELSKLYQIVAVSTRTPQSAAASSKKYSEDLKSTVKGYSGGTSAIAGDPNVHLVAVSVNTPDHLKAVLPVINAGKDAFLEWPSGRNLQETKEIAEASKRAGTRLMVGLQGTQSPTVKMIQKLISDGKIGKVLSTSVVSDVPNQLSYWGPWVAERNLYTADLSSGATLSRVAMGHFMGIFFRLFGDVESVTASYANQCDTAIITDNITRAPKPDVPTRTAPHNTYNQVSASGSTKSGIFYSLYYRANVPWHPGRVTLTWVIDGDSGTIRMEGAGVSSGFINIEDSPLYLNGERVEVPVDEMGNVGRAWYEFAQGPEGNYASIDDAVKVNTFTDAVERSAKEGRRIQL